MKTIYILFSISLIIFTGCETKSEKEEIVKVVKEQLDKRNKFKKPINSKSDNAPTKLPL